MSTRIPNRTRQIRGGPHSAAPWLAAVATETLGSRGEGVPITDHASSWVRRVATEDGEFYVKTYNYETWMRRIRVAARWTGPSIPSRAACEFDALAWFLGRDPDAAEPIAAFEERRLGFVRRAILVTRAWPGERADRWLAESGEAERRALGAAIGRFVGAMHGAGARDGNLDLRNLLARRTGREWRIAKIDSPRFRLRRPGIREDRWTRADWRRLLPQLAAFGVDRDALAAAGRSAVG